MSAKARPTSDLAKRARALGEWLASFRHLWDQPPYYHRQPPWAADDPEFARALADLDDVELAKLRHQPQAIASWCSRFHRELGYSSMLGTFAALPTVPIADLSRFANVAIKGAKWQQIVAFTEALVPALADRQNHLSAFEWCAGKAHLLRLILKTLPDRFVSACALDCDRKLLQQAQDLARRDRLEFSTLEVDLLRRSRPFALDCRSAVFALHACGDVHRQLIADVCAQPIAALGLSPCCYNRTRDAIYRPLSQTCSAIDLPLDKEHLRIPLQGFTAAQAGIRRLRDHEDLWRLAFDELHRAHSGKDVYVPTPPVERTLLRGTFVDFCRHQAQVKNLDLPSHIAQDEWLSRGRERQAKLWRFGLVRQCFARPLEAYLVLDRALALEEAGYEVSLGTFCPVETTPRNLMIVARASC